MGFYRLASPHIYGHRHRALLSLWLAYMPRSPRVFSLPATFYALPWFLPLLLRLLPECQRVYPKRQLTQDGAQPSKARPEGPADHREQSKQLHLGGLIQPCWKMLKCLPSPVAAESNHLHPTHPRSPHYFLHPSPSLQDPLNAIPKCFCLPTPIS
jgi:hypothetical protein